MGTKPPSLAEKQAMRQRARAFQTKDFGVMNDERRYVLDTALQLRERTDTPRLLQLAEVYERYGLGEAAERIRAHSNSLLNDEDRAFLERARTLLGLPIAGDEE